MQKNPQTQRKPASGKKAVFFKLSEESAKHLEASTKFFSGIGQKKTRSALVERAISNLPTSHEHLLDTNCGPVSPLLAAYRLWQNGECLNRARLLSLAEAAHQAIKEHSGLVNVVYVADLLKAFKAILQQADGKKSDMADHTEYYLTKLPERRLGLNESIDATLARIMSPMFGWPVDPISGILVFALCNEPWMDAAWLNESVAPYIGTLIKLAIRENWLRTGKPLLDTEDPANTGYEYCTSGLVKHEDLEIDWATKGADFDARIKMGPRRYAEFNNLPAFMDLLFLIDGIANGWQGGHRPGISLRKDPDTQGAKLVFSGKEYEMSSMLTANQLNAFIELREKVLADEYFSKVLPRLILAYGDI